MARGMALSALGCSTRSMRSMRGGSLMGVSTVFSAARCSHTLLLSYGEQTVSAGVHLAAGFSQWRLALAV
jgi:hypothetical protein